MKTKKLFKTLLGFFLSILILCAVAIPMNANLSFGSTLTASAATQNGYEYVELANEGKENGYWKIRVKNITSKAVEIIYNQKMCFSNDAKKFTGLSHIATRSISANSNSLIEVQTNGTAGYVTFSYISGNDRLVSWAHNLSKKGNIDVSYNKVDAPVTYTEGYVDLSIVGKNDNKNVWYITVTNNQAFAVDLRYSTQMYSENEMRSWSANLSTTTISMNPGTSKVVSITANKSSGWIGFSYIRDNKTRYATYACDLSTNMTMTVEPDVIPA